MSEEIWKTVKLGDIISDIRSGVSLICENRPAEKNEYGILKLSSVNNGYFFPNENKVVINNEVNKIGISPKRDTVLISRSNTLDLVGACAYVADDYPNLALPDLLWELSIIEKEKYFPKWLNYLLCSNKVRSIIKARASGTSGSMKKISRPVLKSIKVDCPPIAEQQKIAEILSTWDKAIDQTSRLIEAKQKFKKALMQKLLSGKKRFPEFGKPVERNNKIPNEWNIKKLKDVGKCLVGLTYAPNDITNESGMLVLRSSNVQGGRLTFDDNVYVRKSLEIKHKTKDGDILVCVRNGSKNLIGKSALITNENTGFAHGAFMMLFRSELYDYLYPLFNSTMYQRQVQRNLGATINSINSSDFYKFKFPFPNRNEQKKIAKVFNTIDKEVSFLTNNLNKLKQQKKGLMQKLLTGQVRVNV